MDINSAEHIGRVHEEYSIGLMAEKWLDNIKANRKHFVTNKPHEFPGMVLFIIGAGPSLKKNVYELKRLPKNSRAMVIASDVVLSFLFDNDIVPDVCISLDGHDHVWDMINSSKKVDTSKVVLYCGIMVSPKLTDNWKGPKHFFLQRANAFAKKIGDEMFMHSRLYRAKKDLKQDNEIGMEDLEVVYSGIRPSVLVGGNVTSAAFYWAIAVMKAWKVVFVGQDFSWTNDDEFYVNKMFNEQSAMQSSSEEKWMHANVNGEIVQTNVSLLKFKKWHDEYSLTYPGYVINATEGGIFGVKQDGSKFNGIEFLTLKDAISKYVFLKNRK